MAQITHVHLIKNLPIWSSTLYEFGMWNQAYYIGLLGGTTPLQVGGSYFPGVRSLPVTGNRTPRVPSKEVLL